MTLKLSIATPVVTMAARSHASWEEDASMEELARIAESADRLGYHHLTCSEHIALPAAELARRGARYWTLSPHSATSRLAQAKSVLQLSSWCSGITILSTLRSDTERWTR